MCLFTCTHACGMHAHIPHGSLSLSENGERVDSQLCPTVTEPLVVLVSMVVLQVTLAAFLAPIVESVLQIFCSEFYNFVAF